MTALTQSGNFRLFILGGNKIVPIVSGTKNDIVLLPLGESTQFSLLSTAVDNVGNRKPLGVAMQDIQELDFPIVIATCPNDCTNNGNCTVFGNCICEDGFYGSDCSQSKYYLTVPLIILSSPLLSSHLFICLSIAGTPPSEPPVFEIPYEVHGIVDEPVLIPIVAILPDRNTTDGLVVYVDNVPTQANFSRGTKEGNRWIFTPDEFGEIPFNLPPGFIGIIELEVTAVAFGARRQRSLAVYIRQSINSTEMLTVSPTMPTEVPSSVSTEITRPTTLTTATSITRETPASTGGISTYYYIIVTLCILNAPMQQLECCTYCMIFPSCQTTLL